MSVLNLASDGLRSILVAIHNTLVYEGSTERERLLELCGHKWLAEDSQLRGTLNRWVELGLLHESDGKINFHPDISKTDRTRERLPSVARRRLLAPENNERFWEIEESRAADFSRAMSWCLAQNIYDFEFSSWDDAQLRILDQAPNDDSLLGKNDTRWNGIRSWAPFLGFGYINGKNRFIVDPTPAVRDAMPTVFGRAKILAANEFLSRLADEMPVIDGGKYRVMVEEKLRETTGPRAWQPTPDRQISTSLSRAILGLIAAGQLTAETRSDATSRLTLTGRDGKPAQNYSHLTWHGKSESR